MKTSYKTLLASLFALSLLASMPAKAQDYPSKPVTLAVSYGAGGATDFQARIVTMVSGNEDYLGQPIVIINKPGAGGRVGWNWLATKADKDGYTLGAYNVPHFIAQSINGGVKYSRDSFEPIANWGADPAVFIVPKDSPMNNMADFVKYAKKNPGKLTVSGAGTFVGHHIAALQVEKAAKIKIQYVPTKGGGAAAMKAVIASDVLAGINNLSDAYRARQSGSIKIIGVADLKRNEEFLPDVPTLLEQKIDVDDSSVNFRGIMVPKGTPKPVIDKLAATFPEIFKHKNVQKQMKNGGSPVRIMNRAEVQAMWKDREVYLNDLLKDLKK